MSHLVSILIPCFNAEPFVGAAVQSALNQTWKEKEVIVVDDGSTDRSWDILQAFSHAPGVRLIKQVNKGQCAAANRAFKECKGDYIKFFDADDLLEPKTIQLQMERLSGNDTSVASAEWGRFYGSDLGTFKLDPQAVWRDMKSLDWLVEAWKDARPMMQSALWLIPRQVLDRSGLWDERLNLINDFEFFARVLCHCEEVRFTSGARLYYRSGLSGSLSGQKSRKAVESAFSSLTTGTSHLLARRQDAAAKTACANVLQDFIYTYYPDHPDLLDEMAQRVAELGGSNLSPSGGPRFQKLSAILGWKLARRMQRVVT